MNIKLEFNEIDIAHMWHTATGGSIIEESRATRRFELVRGEYFASKDAITMICDTYTDAAILCSGIQTLPDVKCYIAADTRSRESWNRYCVVASRPLPEFDEDVSNAAVKYIP